MPTTWPLCRSHCSGGKCRSPQWWFRDAAFADCRVACCGVCVLRRRREQGRVFPAITYSEALACLKAGAIHLKFEEAAAWGTHAFRRGWATEALRAGGVTALFYSGGWRGVAAFAYVDAQSRGAVSGAEFLVDFSDSSSDTDA